MERKYRLVQGLVRGLEVLRAMNQAAGASGSSTTLAQTTGLHRTTVKRLLETLREAGFVRRLPDDSFRLTFRVRTLSDGFTDETWVAQVAAPLLRQLTEQVRWPSDLVTLEGEELVIRDTTHTFSPLSFHPAMMGQRLPFLQTAVGRAYLAFCAAEERDALLAMLRDRSDKDGQLARDTRRVRTMLQSTRARGYAINEGDWIGGGRFGALAVPIMHHGHARACINLIFSKRAISTAQAAAKYLASMKKTAEAIEANL
jgi:IclR family mhp operon transcriptional activator